MLTLGVEEEFLLVDPEHGVPVPLAGPVRAVLGRQPALDTEEVRPEMLQVQLETATPVCTGLDEIGGHLLRLRHALSAAAETAGCRLAATGSAPLAGPLPAPVTEEHRYRALMAAAPQLADEQLINGMHCHVGVPDRATAVAVVNRLRPWLCVLIAMGANSPFWQGADTGFASWRTVVFDRWPAGGQPPPFAGEADYERRADALVATGVVGDRGQFYWRARPSERFPTVEVRALDVQLRVEETVMFAGLIRALVDTAIADTAAGAPLPGVHEEVLRAADWQAARHGLNGMLVDPFTAGRRRAGDLVRALLAQVRPALERAGDLRTVSTLAERLVREGTAADRQRRAHRAGGWPGVLQLTTGTVD
ncbi:carboxylate-amine ligase [Streptomyces aidingensis]|uniref:Putative glutamate--cysteine ligase 2 n=1 Tax=Streptomyces aidingensis TaxID=910347 RepID=A0A1I1SPP8_9ACTN|nr:glutamate--cysteine ligase [Streptomyces aidingensis]SFD45863.1 carboxylate-amine ligase [Streptomyces aidingensis]